MTDESGTDVKILAVPVDKLSSIYHSINDTDQVSDLLKNQIQHFFEHYKDLEPNKCVMVK